MEFAAGRPAWMPAAEIHEFLRSKNSKLLNGMDAV
jgi:hypothetical protein